MNACQLVQLALKRLNLVRQYLTVTKFLTKPGLMAKSLPCSFCGKSDQEVRKLAAGPGGLYICDKCVASCQVIVNGDAEGPPRTFEPTSWPTDRLLALLAPVQATIKAHRTHLNLIVETLRAREIS